MPIVSMSAQTIPEPHPGEILLEEFIKLAGITPYRFAKVLTGKTSIRSSNM